MAHIIPLESQIYLEECILKFRKSFISGIYKVVALDNYRTLGCEGYAIKYKTTTPTHRGTTEMVYICFPDMYKDDYNAGDTYPNFNPDDCNAHFQIVHDKPIPWNNTLRDFCIQHFSRYGVPYYIR